MSHEMADVVELHVATDDREAVQQELAKFCEQQGLYVVRLFWRGFEPDDEIQEP